MEGLLSEELRSFGAREVKETRAGVAFSGNLEAAYRACLWSRIANRILLPLKTFAAPDPAKLYGGVKGIRWSDHLSAKQTIAVDFSSSRSQITHTHFGALKVKDAVVDQIRSVQGERPSVDPARPDVRINVYLHDDQATVSIDLSGDSLHRRGYRLAEGDDSESPNVPRPRRLIPGRPELGRDRSESGPELAGARAALLAERPARTGGVARHTRTDRAPSGPASLKENLAAAILMLAGWPARVKADGARASLLDPMCGTGTLPIEAAMMAADRAPGLGRRYYGFQGWLRHDSGLWDRLQDEARGREIRDRKLLPRITGTDRDFRAVRGALANVERAGLTGRVHIEKRELAESAPVSGEERGIIVLNPPYGERLGDVEELRPLYSQIGDVFKQRFQGWEGFVFTGSPELSKEIGLKANRRFVLYNGAIECRLFKFELY